MSFLKSAEFSFEEIETRKNARDRMLTFGVEFLDNAMLGILKNDLVLIGAGSGAGKTQLCCSIAKANIENGKRVHYIALEAEHLEIEKRIKFQIFSNHFFNDPERPKGVTLSFQEWMVGDFIDSCAKYEASAANEFMQKYSTLFVFYKADKFDVIDLIQTVLSCADETDLIILDHVHYMDYEDSSENVAIKKIAITARTLALENSCPIILVSHLRKKDKASRDFAPGLEEFHGSSDLYKIATKAITLAPGNVDNGNMETYFRIVKNRFEGSVTRYVAKTFYNPREARYEANYELGLAGQNRDEGFVRLDPNNHPSWGKYFAVPSSTNSQYFKSEQAPYGKSKRTKTLPANKSVYQGD